MKKEKIILPVILFLVLALMPLVFTKAEMVNPGVSPFGAGKNYSASIFLNLSYTNATDVTNAQTANSTCYHNSTASWAAVSGTETIVEKATTNSSFYVTLTLSSTNDRIGANVNCSIGNNTVINGSSPFVVNFDSTNPVVTVDIEEDSIEVGGLFRYTTLTSDATVGIKAESCNITSPDSVISIASIDVTALEFPTDRLSNKGTWTLECQVGDYSGNNKTESTTIGTYPLNKPYIIKQPTTPLNKKIVFVIIAIIAAIILLKRK